ncbi:MAG TPA: hypothetical protein VHE83_08595 [Mycobacteriales bacterium]|nr:hypothetical protein [Mycobacteriales bacterium]
MPDLKETIGEPLKKVAFTGLGKVMTFVADPKKALKEAPAAAKQLPTKVATTALVTIYKIRHRNDAPVTPPAPAKPAAAPAQAAEEPAEKPAPVKATAKAPAKAAAKKATAKKAAPKKVPAKKPATVEDPETEDPKDGPVPAQAADEALAEAAATPPADETPAPADGVVNEAAAPALFSDSDQ